MNQYAVASIGQSYSDLVTFPNFNDIESYARMVNSVPMLTPEQETEFATDYRQNNNVQAAHALVVSHLRVVVSIARKYIGYGLPQSDLIQEGSIGLMKAVQRFDPDRGVRLVSFAMHWIKAEIHEYIIRNWRMVKIATTKAQRKLFFNLRSLKSRDNLSTAEIEALALVLNVKPEEVVEMDQRLTGRDVAIDGGTSDDDDTLSMAPIHYLSDDRQEPSNVLQQIEYDKMQSTGLSSAIESLDERSKDIILSRWLINEGEHGLTLHDLADRYKVSAERIRQIEVQALKKLKKVLEPA